MASPPSSSTPLSLSRQRPTLALPNQSHRRKPSIASATSTPSAHPLRQTSFPPPAPDSLEAQHIAAEDAALRLQQYSPSQASFEGDGDITLGDEFSDSEIVSAISGPAGPTAGDDGAGAGAGVGRKRKRGAEKGTRGRPRKTQSLSQSHARTGSASLVNGEGERGRRGTTADADNEASEDSDDEQAGGGGTSGRVPLYEGGQLTLLEQQHAKEARSKFRHYMEILDALPLTSKDPSRDGLTVRDMSDRYDVYLRAKLRNTDLRRLVNQTLSQSVPSNVVTVVSSYAKMFAGQLIERAREVQEEWMAVEAERPDRGKNLVFEKIRAAEEMAAAVEEDEEGEEEGEGKGQENEAPESASSPTSSEKGKEKTEAKTPIKGEQSSSSPPELPDPPAAKLDQQVEPIRPGGAGGLKPFIAECDRGPLLPDHLREALRRYKKARSGGTVGFTGLSLEGREVAASRMGGRRLFR